MSRITTHSRFAIEVEVSKVMEALICSLVGGKWCVIWQARVVSGYIIPRHPGVMTESVVVGGCVVGFGALLVLSGDCNGHSSMIHHQRFALARWQGIRQILLRTGIWRDSGVVIPVKWIFGCYCFLCRFLGNSCKLIFPWVDARAVFLFKSLLALMCFRICGIGRNGFILYRLERVAGILTVSENKAPDTGRLPDFSNGDPMAT